MPPVETLREHAINGSAKGRQSLSSGTTITSAMTEKRSLLRRSETLFACGSDDKNSRSPAEGSSSVDRSIVSAISSRVAWHPIIVLVVSTAAVRGSRIEHSVHCLDVFRLELDHFVHRQPDPIGAAVERRTTPGLAKDKRP